MRRISRCFTWVSISGLGEPNIYHDLGNFTRKWEVSGGCLTVRISGGPATGDNVTDLERINVY